MSTLTELYELTKDFRAAEEAFSTLEADSEMGEVREIALDQLASNLLGLVLPLNDKLTELYKWRAKEKARQDSIKAELDRLTARLASSKRTSERTIEFIDSVVKGVLESTGQKNVKLPIGTMYLQKNPDRVEVDVDRAAMWPDEFKTQVYREEVTKKVDKAKLKKLTGYQSLPGVVVHEGNEGVRYK
jgi:hypothetical protein